MTATEPSTSRRVFLSFTRDDLDLAQRIREALVGSGVRVESQSLGFSSGGSLLSGLHEAVRASDVVILLLTPAALDGLEADADIELASRDMDRRGVDLIPVLAAPADLPLALSGRGVLDLTRTSDAYEGLRRLAEQILATSRIDFSSLTPRTFENMVADLLASVGFHLDEASPKRDTGIDILATYPRTDPFGAPETETWLVETKFYSRERVSTETIRELAGMLAPAPGDTRGLLVTNGHLTSMALDVLAGLSQRSGLRLQVLDGADLTRLLRQHPAVIERHFPAGPASSRQESHANS